MQHVTVNGVDLAYRIDGDAGLPWLILSNGLATDHRLWNRQIAALTKSHRVLRYDTRGHGGSTAPAPPYALDDLAADLLALMEHLKIASGDICGLSLGGTTALAAAATAPEKFDRVICCDARADAPQDYTNMWRQRAAAVATSGVKTIADPTLDRWFTPAFAATVEGQQTVAFAREMILATNVDGYCGCAAALSQIDLLASLPKFRKPLHYIIGSDDKAIAKDVMAEMARLTPGATLTVIPHAAHLPNLEQPEAFNDVLARMFGFGHAKRG